MYGLLALTGMVVIAGCGGGTPKPPSTPTSTITLRGPVEIPDQPGAIGGSIFTLAARDNDPGIMIDQAVGATVTVTGRTATGDSYSKQTYTTVRGGYSFDQVPAGTYSVAGSIASPYAKDVQLTGIVDHIIVRGNIPTLMVNVLIGDDANKGTFTGAVTQNGHNAVGALVSMEATAFTTAYPADTTHQSSVTISTTTDDKGSYSFSVPAGCDHYFVSAHSDTSMVTDSDKITTLSTTAPTTVNLTLTNATTPLFARIVLDIVSATLPEASPQAANQALMTQLAVARALHAPQARIARLQKLQTGTRATRLIQGIVENDLYWDLQPIEPGQQYVDEGVQGFNVYKASAQTDAFTYTGSVHDPYQLYFYDNDPALRDLQSRYYTVTSYAANQQESTPAVAILAKPLAQLAVQGPAPDSTVSKTTGRFSWNSVPGAVSYVVVKFDTPPSFNTVPLDNMVVHSSADTSEDMTTLAPGTYWWGVTAFNNSNPTYATAASFTTYYKVTVTN